MGSSGEGAGSVVVDNHLVFLEGPLEGFPGAFDRQTGAMWPTLPYLWHLALRNLHSYRGSHAHSDHKARA